MPGELLRTVAWRPGVWGRSDVASLFRLNYGGEVSGVSDLQVDLNDMTWSLVQGCAISPSWGSGLSTPC